MHFTVTFVGTYDIHRYTANIFIIVNAPHTRLYEIDQLPFTRTRAKFRCCMKCAYALYLCVAVKTNS